MNHKDDYDWLNDPFDEKKTAREQVQASMSGGTKLALGCGCLLVVVGCIVLAVIALGLLAMPV